MSQLPQGWTQTNIKALGGLVGGKTPSKSESKFWERGTLPWVSPKDMKVFDLSSSIDNISSDALLSGGMTLLPKHSVLMVTRSGILSHTFPVALAALPVTINQDLKAILPSPAFLPRYMAYQMKSLQDRILHTCSKTGTTVASIETEKLENLPIMLAPLAEQQRIVDKLDSVLVRVKVCRDHLSGITPLINCFRESVLAAAVSGKLTRDWRKEMENSDESSGIPSTWGLCRISEAGKVQLGRQRSPKFHHGSGMRPYLRVQNVFEDKIDLSDVMEMHFSDEDFARYHLQYGDILLNEGQSPQFLGRPAMYRGELPGCCFTNTLIRFRAYENVEPEFALIVFRHQMHSGRYLSEGTITTNIAHLGAGRFGAVEFPLPPLQEQQEIVARAKRLFDFADRLLERLESAEALAQALAPSLLSKAFRGELLPQDSNEEPIGVLLERLNAARTVAVEKPQRTRRPSQVDQSLQLTAAGS